MLRVAHRERKIVEYMSQNMCGFIVALIEKGEGQKVPYSYSRGALSLFLSETSEPISRYTTKCVTYGHWPVLRQTCTVTFPDKEHCHSPCPVLMSHPTQSRKLSWLE